MAFRLNDDGVAREPFRQHPDMLLREDHIAVFQAGAKRAEVRESLGSYEDYLRSLQVELVVRPFDSLGRSRIAQLINKSNQFNLTTRRRTEAEVNAIEASEDHLGLQFRLIDTFGDSGMISVVVLRWEADSAVIDTWLMSCRVLDR